MGVESYLVRLTGQQDVKTIGNYLTLVLRAMPDSTQSPPSASDQHFVIPDGRHVLEFELAREYDATEATAFAANRSWSIDSAQKEWRRAFGSEEAGVSVADACRKFYFEPVSK